MFDESSLTYSLNLLFNGKIDDDYFSLDFNLFNLLYNKPTNQEDFYKPLNYHPDFKFVLDEPLTKQILEQFLSHYRIKALTNIFPNFSKESQTMSCKGTFFQNIFLNYLQNFGKDGKRDLTDLPFFKSCKEFPNWLSNIHFKVSSTKFHLSQTEDYSFLDDFVQNGSNTEILIVPSHVTGPDGLLILKTPNDFFLLVLIGSKYSSDRITDTKLISNDHATNIANLFKSKGKTTNIRKLYEKGLFKTIIEKVKILYLLIEYSEANSTKERNEFICHYQNLNAEQFAIQITENEVIKSFKQSDDEDFKQLGMMLEKSLFQRNSSKRKAAMELLDFEENPKRRKTTKQQTKNIEPRRSPRLKKKMRNK